VSYVDGGLRNETEGTKNIYINTPESLFRIFFFFIRLPFVREFIEKYCSRLVRIGGSVQTMRAYLCLRYAYTHVFSTRSVILKYLSAAHDHTIRRRDCAFSAPTARSRQLYGQYSRLLADWALLFVYLFFFI